MYDPILEELIHRGVKHYILGSTATEGTYYSTCLWKGAI